MSQEMKVNFIADICCPWCYIGLHELLVAKEKIADEIKLTIQWIPFELFPHLPKGGVNRALHMAMLFGSGRSAKQISDYVNRAAAKVGLHLQLDHITKSINTFHINRIILHYGKENNPADLAMQFFQSFFEEGQDLSSVDTLVAIMNQFGWKDECTRAFLTTDQSVDEMFRLRELELSKETRSVPVIEICGIQRFVGAQSAQTLIRAIKIQQRKMQTI